MAASSSAAAGVDDATLAAAQREQQAGNEAVGRREWAAAHEHYCASIALHATPAALSNRAAARLVLGRPAESAADARAALDLDAKFQRAYLRLSAAQRALGDDESALAAALQGLALAESTASPLVTQLRDAVAAAGGAARPERATDEAHSHVRKVCCHCGVVKQKMLWCNACRQVAFCGAACQRAGWPAHRDACRVAAREMVSASAEAGLGKLPRGEQAHALYNWVDEHPAHWMALHALAWHVQHAPMPPEWRSGTGETGAVLLAVLRDDSDDSTLRVALSPLAAMRSAGVLRAAAGVAEDSSGVAALQASLGRVDIAVGFLCSVQDKRLHVHSMGRVRYNLSAELLAEMAEAETRGRRMRVDTRTMRAEVEVALYRKLLTSR